MPILEKKIEINAPVKKVWEILTDMERYPKWQIDKKEIKKLEPDKFFEKTTQGDFYFSITELVENERMSLKTDHPEVTGASYILNGKGNITELSCSLDFKTIDYEKMIARSLKIKTQGLKMYAEYLEDGGDPDEYDAKLILTKP